MTSLFIYVIILFLSKLKKKEVKLN